MDINSILENYSSNLQAYLSNPGEGTLYQAFLFSSELVEKEVAPDEIVEIHTKAIDLIVQGRPPILIPSVLLQSFSFLLEIMVAYGVAHKKYLENQKTEFARLQSYIELIENLNRGLDEKVSELEVIAQIADVLTRENNNLGEAMKKVSEVLEKMLPDCIFYGFKVFEGVKQGKYIFRDGKEEKDLLNPFNDVTGIDDIIIIDSSKNRVEIGFPFWENETNLVLGVQCLTGTSLPSRQFWTTLKNLFQSYLIKMDLFRKLKDEANRDALTNVFNRRFFLESLQREINGLKRYGHPLSLVLLDIDKFKDINDRYGHLVGDQVLREVAVFLKNIFRATDIICRYGGDEFVVLLPHTGLEQAKQLVLRVHKETMDHAFASVELSISIGFAEATKEDNVDGIINRTDKALYQAKRAVNKSVTASSLSSTVEIK